MLSDIDNARKLMELLGNDEFVEAITRADRLVDETEETLERVEQIESDAQQALDETSEALDAVDRRITKVDETLSLIEAEIEAGFSLILLFFAFDRWTAGDPFLAAILFFLGLLGASALVVTIVRMPQIQRLDWLLERILEVIARHTRFGSAKRDGDVDIETRDGDPDGRTDPETDSGDGSRFDTRE
jgi:Flp pilus assembly protein TadB